MLAVEGIGTSSEVREGFENMKKFVGGRFFSLLHRKSKEGAKKGKN